MMKARFFLPMLDFPRILVFLLLGAWCLALTPDSPLLPDSFEWSRDSPLALATACKLNPGGIFVLAGYNGGDHPSVQYGRKCEGLLDHNLKCDWLTMEIVACKRVALVFIDAAQENDWKDENEARRFGSRILDAFTKIRSDITKPFDSVRFTSVVWGWGPPQNLLKAAKDQFMKQRVSPPMLLSAYFDVDDFDNFDLTQEHYVLYIDFTRYLTRDDNASIWRAFEQWASIPRSRLTIGWYITFNDDPSLHSTIEKFLYQHKSFMIRDPTFVGRHYRALDLTRENLEKTPFKRLLRTMLSVPSLPGRTEISRKDHTSLPVSVTSKIASQYPPSWHRADTSTKKLSSDQASSSRAKRVKTTVGSKNLSSQNLVTSGSNLGTSPLASRAGTSSATIATAVTLRAASAPAKPPSHIMKIPPRKKYAPRSSTPTIVTQSTERITFTRVSDPRVVSMGKAASPSLQLPASKSRSTLAKLTESPKKSGISILQNRADQGIIDEDRVHVGQIFPGAIDHSKTTKLTLSVPFPPKDNTNIERRNYEVDDLVDELRGASRYNAPEKDSSWRPLSIETIKALYEYGGIDPKFAIDRSDNNVHSPVAPFAYGVSSPHLPIENDLGAGNALVGPSTNFFPNPPKQHFPPIPGYAGEFGPDAWKILAGWPSHSMVDPFDRSDTYGLKSWELDRDLSNAGGSHPLDANSDPGHKISALRTTKPASLIEHHSAKPVLGTNIRHNTGPSNTIEPMTGSSKRISDDRAVSTLASVERMSASEDPKKTRSQTAQLSKILLHTTPSSRAEPDYPQKHEGKIGKTATAPGENPLSIIKDAAGGNAFVVSPHNLGKLALTNPEIYNNIFLPTRKHHSPSSHLPLPANEFFPTSLNIEEPGHVDAPPSMHGKDAHKVVHVHKVIEGVGALPPDNKLISLENAQPNSNPKGVIGDFKPGTQIKNTDLSQFVMLLDRLYESIHKQPWGKDMGGHPLGSVERGPDGIAKSADVILNYLERFVKLKGIAEKTEFSGLHPNHRYSPEEAVIHVELFLDRSKSLLPSSSYSGDFSNGGETERPHLRHENSSPRATLDILLELARPMLESHDEKVELFDASENKKTGLFEGRDAFQTNSMLSSVTSSRTELPFAVSDKASNSKLSPKLDGVSASTARDPSRASSHFTTLISAKAPVSSGIRFGGSTLTNFAEDRADTSENETAENATIGVEEVNDNWDTNASNHLSNEKDSDGIWHKGDYNGINWSKLHADEQLLKNLANDRAHSNEAEELHDELNYRGPDEFPPIIYATSLREDRPEEKGDHGYDSIKAQFAEAPPIDQFDLSSSHSMKSVTYDEPHFQHSVNDFFNDERRDWVSSPAKPVPSRAAPFHNDALPMHSTDSDGHLVFAEVLDEYYDSAGYKNLADVHGNGISREWSELLDRGTVMEDRADHKMDRWSGASDAGIDFPNRGYTDKGNIRVATSVLERRLGSPTESNRQSTGHNFRPDYAAHMKGSHITTSFTTGARPRSTDRTTVALSLADQSPQNRALYSQVSVDDGGQTVVGEVFSESIYLNRRMDFDYRSHRDAESVARRVISSSQGPNEPAVARGRPNSRISILALTQLQTSDSVDQLPGELLALQSGGPEVGDPFDINTRPMTGPPITGASEETRTPERPNWFTEPRPFELRQSHTSDPSAQGSVPIDRHRGSMNYDTLMNEEPTSNAANIDIVSGQQLYNDYMLNYAQPLDSRLAHNRVEAEGEVGRTEPVDLDGKLWRNSPDRIEDHAAPYTNPDLSAHAFRSFITPVEETDYVSDGSAGSRTEAGALKTNAEAAADYVPAERETTAQKFELRSEGRDSADSPGKVGIPKMQKPRNMVKPTPNFRNFDASKTHSDVEFKWLPLPFMTAPPDIQLNAVSTELAHSAGIKSETTCPPIGCYDQRAHARKSRVDRPLEKLVMAALRSCAQGARFVEERSLSGIVGRDTSLVDAIDKSVERSVMGEFESDRTLEEPISRIEQERTNSPPRGPQTIHSYTLPSAAFETDDRETIANGRSKFEAADPIEVCDISSPEQTEESCGVRGHVARRGIDGIEPHRLIMPNESPRRGLNPLDEVSYEALSLAKVSPPPAHFVRDSDLLRSGLSHGVTAAPQLSIESRAEQRASQPGQADKASGVFTNGKPNSPYSKKRPDSLEERFLATAPSVENASIAGHNGSESSSLDEAATAEDLLPRSAGRERFNPTTEGDLIADRNVYFSSASAFTPAPFFLLVLASALILA